MSGPVLDSALDQADLRAGELEELVADRATNIRERVVCLVTGETPEINVSRH